jgi:hypothetical protein
MLEYQDNVWGFSFVLDPFDGTKGQHLTSMEDRIRKEINNYNNELTNCIGAE